MATAASALQPSRRSLMDRRSAETPNRHEGVKIGVESDHYTPLIPGESENFFVLGPLHAQLGNVQALISEPTKKLCRVNGVP
jgi:hypothetical protein